MISIEKGGRRKSLAFSHVIYIILLHQIMRMTIMNARQRLIVFNKINKSINFLGGPKANSIN